MTGAIAGMTVDVSAGSPYRVAIVVWSKAL